MLLVAYKHGIKVAETPINDDTPVSEVQTILEIWAKDGRSWSYEQEVKPFYWPKFEIKEVCLERPQVNSQ